MFTFCAAQQNVLNLINVLLILAKPIFFFCILKPKCLLAVFLFWLVRGMLGNQQQDVKHVLVPVRITNRMRTHSLRSTS